ncbi:MAG: biotin--[acetyl-CoA-carboxylase] ligase [Desulfobacterales bacterium]|nr:biotin--[acetyl-CoA-carboxylase] ligase [Desulfobacterales bacterium]
MLPSDPDNAYWTLPPKEPAASRSFSVPAFTEQRIPNQCPEKAPDIHLFQADACSSSMDLAWWLVEGGRLPPWASVLAARQTKGRGQFRRQWHSPAGNLYGALRLPWLCMPWRPLTPLLVAQAIYTVLSALGLRAEIKWPNDILVNRKKAGGILIEERSRALVAGIGLNLVSAPAMHELPEPTALPAGHLGEFGIAMAPLDLWERIVQAVYRQMAERSAAQDVKEFVRDLENHMAFVGEQVVFTTQGNKDLPAIVLGLDAGGGIRLMTIDGEKVLLHGSISPMIR